MQSTRLATRSRRLTVAVAVKATVFAAVTVVAVLTPASGQAAGTASPTKTNQQCVIAAIKGGSVQRCFATAAEAVAFGSGGQIRVPSDATTHDAVVALRTHETAAARGAIGTQASNIIGIEYDGSYRSGAAKYFSVSGDCYSGSRFGFPKLSSYGWNDKINSAQTFVGCVGQHYDDTYYSDTMVSVFGTRDDFGRQNNKTSSIKFI